MIAMRLSICLMGICLWMMTPQYLKSVQDDENRFDPGRRDSIFIDSVWAGHRVGFALLTEQKRQYVAYYNKDRNMTVGQRNLSDDQFKVLILPPKMRTHKAGTSTILEWDSHNYVTLARDQEGYLHLAGNMHVNGLTYFRSKKPDDITTLQQISSMVGSLEDRCTYPKFMKREDGTLLFKYRDGGSGNGSEIYNLYDTESKQWRRLHEPLIDGRGKMNAYTSSPILGPDGWYHLYWVWRDTPDCETNHDLSYMKSPDLEQWFDIEGRPLQLPAHYRQKSLIVDPIPSGGGIINLAAKLAFDEKNNPLFIYHKYGPSGNLQLFSALRRNEKWEINQITRWNYRWEFSGRGSINREFELHDFKPDRDGHFIVTYDHIKYGHQLMILSKNLEIIQIDNPSEVEAPHYAIQGDFPGLEIRTSRDLSGQPSKTWNLKWESLPSNRDRPRPKPWPAASALYLFKHELQQEEQKEEHTKRRLVSIDDVHASHPGLLDQLFQSLDLNVPGFSSIKKQYQSGNLVDAAKKLLAYYRMDSICGARDINLLSGTYSSTSDAVKIRQDTITIQGQSGRLPRTSDGFIQWSYKGPNDDMEWAWGLNRHYHIRTMLDAYLIDGENENVYTIDDHIQDWIRSSWPYPGVKSRTAMWRGLEVSYRAKIWARIFYELMYRPDLSPATKILMLTSLPDHAHYLRHFHGRSNWLTMEMSGLATIATKWPEFKKAPLWLDYAKSQMSQSLKKQIYPDGVQTELTSHYHYVALNNFNQFLHICQAAKVPLDPVFKTEIEKMWHYLAYSMRPDGYGVLNNDSDRDYNRDRIQKAAQVFHRSDWAYIATHGQSGQKPAQTCSFFPWAGQLIMRQNFTPQSQWAFFDVGPWGSGHQHNDKLHLSVSAFGQDFLVDAGRFAYQGAIADKFRSYARSTSGHNAILIDGKGQEDDVKEVDRPLSKNHFQLSDHFAYAWNKTSDFNELEDTNEHLRSVMYLHDIGWIVIDKIQTTQPREIDVLWHWHPDVSVKNLENGSVLGSHTSGHVQITEITGLDMPIQSIRGQEEPFIQGWYSEKYNEYQPNTVTSFQIKGSEESILVWYIEPYTNETTRIHCKIASIIETGVNVYLTDDHDVNRKVFVPFKNSELARVL